MDPLLPNTGTHETTGLSVQCRIHRAHGRPDEDEHVCAWERGDAGRIGWDRGVEDTMRDARKEGAGIAVKSVQNTPQGRTCSEVLIL